MRNRILLLCVPFLMLLTNNSFAAFSSKASKEPASKVINRPDSTSIQEALKEFNSLSKHEKRSRMREMKKAIKDFKALKKAGSDINTNTLLLVILAILIPPLAVYLHEGELNNRFWISVLLTVLGYVLFGFGGILFLGSLPGIIYALYVILSGT